MRQILGLSILTALLLIPTASAHGDSQLSDQSVDIQKSYELRPGFLDRKVTLVNNGNSSETVSGVTVPRYFSPALKFSNPPDSEHKGPVTKRVEWESRLESGEEKTYTVSYAYWRVLMVLMVAGLAGYGVRKHRHHQLLSKSKEEKGETARIDIDIYNTGNDMENITVEEFVPSSLEIDEVITGDPEIEENENGQKITWSIDKLGEGDERVLSYVLRSKEDINAVFTVPGSKILTDIKEITESNQLEVELKPSDREPT